MGPWAPWPLPASLFGVSRWVHIYILARLAYMMISEVRGVLAGYPLQTHLGELKYCKIQGGRVLADVMATHCRPT